MAENKPHTQQIIGFTASRILLNTVQRMVYPFLPIFAAGLGVELRTIELVVVARSGVGLLGPLVSTTADSFGRRWAMLVSLLLFTVGVFTVFFFPNLLGFSLGLVLAQVGKTLFDPSMQAYISDRIPFEKRGQVLATTELAWSLSFIVGVPIASWLIAMASWRAPFLLFAVLGILFSTWLLRIIPNDRPIEVIRKTRHNLQKLISKPEALLGLGFGIMLSFSNEMINIVFGGWLENSFGLAVTGLGLSAAIIGIADLLGEGLVISLVDRVGARSIVVVAMLLNGLVSVALGPLGSLGSAWALFGLFLFFFTFEISIVASIPIMSEVVADARATMLGGYSAASSGGRMLGAFVGPLVFRGLPIMIPMLSNGVIALLINLIAIGLLLNLKYNT